MTATTHPKTRFNTQKNWNLSYSFMRTRILATLVMLHKF